VSAPVRHAVVGTAGHIDHGKSTLVHALTGIDPDRLKEEKARGITIELGFADLDLGAGRTVSFVDVPGHERFVRHMVAGATGIDAVVLVVAADAGIQPQTREHLDICRLLDVRRGIVALTKIDLVGEDLREVVRLELREALAGTFLDGAPHVAVSARTGEGLDALRHALADLVDGTPPRAATGVARLPVDRSFVLRGFGTVVTGTLASGTLREGQEIEVLPGGRRARVRGLQVHGRRVDRAVAGQRTAVNVQGLSTDDVPRGAMLVDPASLRTTTRLWARVRWLDHAPESLRAGAPVRFHHGTSELGARFRVLGVAEGEDVDIEVFLDGPAPIVPGDRFILRQTAPLDTVGGGVVLDARPPRGRAAREQRHALDGIGGGASLGVVLARAGRAGVEPAAVAADLGLTRGDARERLDALAADGAAENLAGRWFGAVVLRSLADAVDAALEGFHRAEPLRAGISRERLRGAVAPDMPIEAWRAWLDGRAAAGLLRTDGERVASASHEVVLSDRERESIERIELRFREAGLEPPDPADVVRDEGGERGERLLELLVERGRLVRIRDGRPFHVEALDGLYRRILEHRRTSSSIDVGTFKELFGVTRKNAIPLLEHLDAERRTRRVGNVREILDV